jgi:hypothetical protein
LANTSSHIDNCENIDISDSAKFCQRALHERNFGKAGMGKLKAAYSLDVPGRENMKLSLSLCTLNPEKQNTHQEKFMVVEDKLISSSMPRLDKTARHTRRLSWAPRGSRHSVVGQKDSGK